MFTEQLPDLLDYISNLPGLVCLVVDMNIHSDNPLQSLTNQTLTTLNLYDLSKSLMGPLIYAVISLTGLLFDLMMTSIENLLLLTHLNQTIIALNPTSMFQSLSSTLFRTVWNMANIGRSSYIAELSSVSEFSSVEMLNQYCDFLRTVLDKHAPTFLWKVIIHNSSPWFESIRDELFIAKRE